jgi:Rrf2 family nitric oxide-sensitive transcriptional repressor
MQLTRFSDYTLRVLIAVGLSEEQGTTIGAIAQSYGISRNHLMKVVHQLGHAGYLHTARGKGGGLRLARAAEEIRLGDVLRYTEGAFAIVPCFDENAPTRCAIEPACVLKGVLSSGVTAFLEVLDRYTLADLLRPRRRLQALLDAGPKASMLPA